MKNYQKLTIVTAVLGLIIPLLGIALYFYVNSVIGIPLLALFLGGVLLVAIGIIAINVGAIVVVFKVKNKKLVGGILIGCGLLLLVIIHFFAIPALILFILSSIMAFRDKVRIDKK